MRRDVPKSVADYTPLFFPAFMLIVFFVIPFSTMIAVSFFKRNPAGFYTPDFVFDNYARFLSAFFGTVLGFSLFLAVAVAVVCVAIAFPSYDWNRHYARTFYRSSYLLAGRRVVPLADRDGSLHFERLREVDFVAAWNTAVPAEGLQEILRSHRGVLYRRVR